MTWPKFLLVKEHLKVFISGLGVSHRHVIFPAFLVSALSEESNLGYWREDYEILPQSL